VALVVATATIPCACRRAPTASTTEETAGAGAVAIAVSATEPEGPGIPPPPDVGVPPRSADRTPSGLATVVLAPGTGTTHPLSYDLVRVRYAGWHKDGKMFGASNPDPWTSDPHEARVNEGGIPGFSEGLKLMVAGERRRMWIPAAIASDAEPRPDLVMDVELVQIVPTPRPPPAPEDVGAPPAGARKTYSGLSWRLVSPGDKAGRLADVSNIAVYNVTMWTRSGEVVASSFPKGEPERGTVSELPYPWSEAIQLMRPGDTIRLWFGDEPSGPRDKPYTAELELIYLYSTLATARGSEPPPPPGVPPPGKGHGRKH
jgi:FKBP-type peptidyl-prolyl cis-trans isomerase